MVCNITKNCVRLSYGLNQDLYSNLYKKNNFIDLCNYKCVIEYEFEFKS